MVKDLKKILSILCVVLMTVTVFSAVITNVLADEEDGEEKIVVSLNPDVAINEYVHMVWQENLTGNMEIYFVNDMGIGNYENTLRNAINHVGLLAEEDDDYEDILNALDKALEKCNEKDFKHSIDEIHHAVKDLEKTGDTEIITMLIDAIRDFAKTNILYAEYDLGFENAYIQESWSKYYFVAIKKYDEKNYDAAIKQFKNAYLKIVEGYEEDETYIGVDLGKIVRISYTDYDSVNPQIFLNGTISVGWKEIMDSESHVYYARSSNLGKTWWYFDGTEYGYNYLCAIGINPYSIDIETTLSVTRALEDIRAVHGCHYIYTPIVKKETGIIDRHYYSPINDPYLELYKDRYEIVPIDGREFYIICGGPIPSPPPQMPDLTFRYAYPSKPCPVEGEKITIYANITNQGDATVSGEVNSTFLQKDEMVGNVSVSPPLKPGEGKQIEKDYTITAGRHVIIQCTADPNNGLPDEGNKDNNIISFPMNIVKEVKNDWGITDTKCLDDMDIHLAGNMAVQSGAKLELNDTAWFINSTTPGEYTINIANGGKAEMNSTFIQSENSSVGYRFVVNGEMNLTRSAIGGMWGDETGMGGVEIYSDASISDSAIHDGNGSGLYVKDAAPMIANTTILYNKVYDIYLDTNANPTLLNCIFNMSKVYFEDTTSKLTIERYMHVRVIDSNDEPLMNATVTVQDNNGVTVYTGLTDYYGYARWIPIPYRTVTKTSDTYLIHTVTATKEGVSGLNVLEGWEDDLNLSVAGSSESTGKPSVLTVDRNKNTYWEGENGQSSYSLTFDTGHSIAQGNMSIYYPEGCTDEYNMTVRVHSHSGIGTTGHGLMFDGVDDYVAATCALPGDSLTIEFWMKPTTVTGYDHPLGLGGDHRATVFVYSDSGCVYYKFYIGGTFIQGSFGTYLLNQWQHIVVTYDGSEVKGYLNGDIGGSTSTSGPINYQNNDVIIGADVGGFKSFNGIVDEVRILNRAMSPDEIKQDYTNQIYNPADGVVGWWHFDENINNTIYDATTNYNNGTIYGATWTNGIKAITFSDNFDNGSATGWGLSSLWHITSDRNWSSSYSLTYNDDSDHNYDTGVANSGDAITSSFTVPRNGQLTFRSWYETEDTGTSWDKKLIYISTNGGSTWTQIYQVSGISREWVPIFINLSDYAGETIRLKFRFDTVNSISNNYEGWYIDDIVVTESGVVHELNVVKSSSDTVTNVVLSPNPDIVDKIEIIFNGWSNTPKISEITGIGDTVSPELAKTIAKERIKLLAKEDYPEWVNATVSDTVLYYSTLENPVLYEVAVLSQNGSILGSMHIPVERRSDPVTHSDTSPWFMSSDNRTLHGYDKSSFKYEAQSNLSAEEEAKVIWQHLAGELIFEGKYGSTTYSDHIYNAGYMDHIHQAYSAYCTPASGAMILRYWGNQRGFKKLVDATQYKVAEKMKTSTTSGTVTNDIPGGMVNAAKHYGVNSYSLNVFWMSFNSYTWEIYYDKPTLEHFAEWNGEGQMGHTMVGIEYLYDEKKAYHWEICWGWHGPWYASSWGPYWCWKSYWQKYNYRLGVNNPADSGNSLDDWYHTYGWDYKRGPSWRYPIRDTIFYCY